MTTQTKKSDPMLEKLLAYSKEHLEPLLSDDGKKWLEEYNEFQKKKKEGLSSLLHDIQQYKENTKMKTFWETIKAFADTFPSPVRSALAFYGNDEEKLTVKMEPLEDEKQQRYRFQNNQEVKFYCTLAEESYVFVIQEDAADGTCNLVAPDEESIKTNLFQGEHFDKLPILTIPYNLFNYQFDKNGNFYWTILAIPHLPWGDEEINKEDLLSELLKLLEATEKPSHIVLEINVS